jgi:hypothetical protein
VRNPYAVSPEPSTNLSPSVRPHTSTKIWWTITS